MTITMHRTSVGARTRSGKVMMLSKRSVFLTFLLWLLIPGAAFGQSWLDVSPGVVYQQPGDPSCYTITVGDAVYMTVDVEYYYQGGGPYQSGGWASLNGNGQAQICVDASMGEGLYEFTALRDSQYYFGSWMPVYSTLYVYSAPHPTIYGLEPTCDDGECVWISGANFQQNSFVYFYSWDWSASQTYWGSAWGYSPGMYVSEDGTVITLHLADPTLLNSFGTYGVHVIVWNPNGTNSGWADTQSPPPVISTGGAACDDGYCISLTGMFPLNAVVDFRIPGQSDVIPNAYSDLNVTASAISLRLNPSVWHDFDVSGLNAWVVNPLLANWSNGHYVAPADRAVIGIVGGVVLSGPQYYVSGWACAKTYTGSIDVHVYIGGPAGVGTFAFSGTANSASEPAVASACNLTGSAYRFLLPIPHAITQNYGNQPIYVYGISPYGLANSLLSNAGTFSVPAVDRSVAGLISGIVLDNQQYYLRGWACAKTNPGSIDLHLYAGGSAGSGTFVIDATANQSSNPATTASCNPGGTHYGFSIQLSLALRQQFGGQTIFVHGISPFGLANSLVDNSGNLTFPPPVATSSREYIYLGDRLLAVDTTNLP